MCNSIPDPSGIAPDKTASRLDSDCHRHMLVRLIHTLALADVCGSGFSLRKI